MFVYLYVGGLPGTHPLPQGHGAPPPLWNVVWASLSLVGIMRMKTHHACHEVVVERVGRRDWENMRMISILCHTTAKIEVRNPVKSLPSQTFLKTSQSGTSWYIHRKWPPETPWEASRPIHSLQMTVRNSPRGDHTIGGSGTQSPGSCIHMHTLIKQYIWIHIDAHIHTHYTDVYTYT